MKPLIVLLMCFVISIFVIKGIKKEYDLDLAGRIAMSGMLVFTAIGHFLFTKGMTLMIPDFISHKELVVHLSGIFEIVMALGLLTSRWNYVTGWVIILFLLLMLPANIYASIHNVDYQNGTYDGKGLAYLWFRVPLQILFIVWTYFFSIHR